MRWARWFFCIFLMHLQAFSQTSEAPTLPRWSDEDAERLIEGEDLISDLLFRPLNESDLTPSVMEGVSLPPRDGENDIASQDRFEERWEKDYMRKPEKFLIDPQKTLSRQEYRDQLSFLKYHDSDSSVKFYVYLFDGSQQIPNHINGVSLWKQHFSKEGPVVLLFYFMGNPSRSEFFASPDLMKSVGKSERARALESAVRHALVKSHPVDQLDGFCEQMSHRIYWMEKALEAGVVAPPDEEAKGSSLPTAQQWLMSSREWWHRWRRLAIISLGSLSCLMLLFWWRHSRRRYRLPVFDVPRRLGGDHGASVGAVISYSNRYLSAQAQREKPSGEWDLL